LEDEEDEEDEGAKKKAVTKEGFPAPIKVSKARSGNKQYGTDLEETFRLFEEEIIDDEKSDEESDEDSDKDSENIK
jgi:hypothetical protein